MTTMVALPILSMLFVQKQRYSRRLAETWL
jgi:hypothetical protein